MKNKLVVRLAVLLCAFFLGGVSFYYLGEVTGQHRGYVSLTPPNVPKQVIEGCQEGCAPPFG
jgi:hypothetical protein